MTSDFKEQIRQFFQYTGFPYFVYLDPEPEAGVETFIVVERNGDVTAFNRVAEASNMSTAQDVAVWFAMEPEGQEVLVSMLAGMDEKLRRGDEIQTRGELELSFTSPTRH